jgi:Tol biopolymer transport system component
MRTRSWIRRWLIGGLITGLMVPIQGAGTPSAVASSNLDRVRFAYVVDGRGPNHVSFARADGSHHSLFVKGRDPAWAPDGERLTFRTGNPQHPGGNPTRINVIGVDGSRRHFVRLRRNGEASGEAGPAAWSPDGRWIAFDTLAGIYVMRPNGKRMHRVSAFPGHHLACYDLEPSWRPNGNQLVFAVLCDGGDLGLWSVRLDGSHRAELLGTGGRFVDTYQPAWSPDGRRIAFVGVRGRPRHRYRYDIYTVRPDGSRLTRLTHGRTYPYEPAWSPSGRRIAFTEDGKGVFVMDVDGSGVTHLPLASENACCLAWRPKRGG